MICQKCGKNNATTHIKTVVNGVVHEKNLCGYCAAKEGYNSMSHNSLAGMLVSMLGEAAGVRTATSAKKCPNCNSTFSDIAEKGKIGETRVKNILAKLRKKLREELKKEGFLE